MIDAVIHAAHWLSGLITMAEALNKLERTALCGYGIAPRQRAVNILKACAWSLLAIGGGGAVITPILPLESPTLQDACVMLGFAVLIVRTRIKEG